MLGPNKLSVQRKMGKAVRGRKMGRRNWEKNAGRESDSPSGVGGLQEMAIVVPANGVCRVSCITECRESNLYACNSLSALIS